MKKRMNSFRLETFGVASLGVHLLLFLALSLLYGDAETSLISPPRLEVHLFSFASPAIAEEKPLPRKVFPTPERKRAALQPKTQPLDLSPEERTSPTVQTVASQVSNEPLKHTLLAQNESPTQEAPVEQTNPILHMDEEPFWIQTATPSSTLAIAPSEESQRLALGGGGQEEKIQVAKGEPLFERETSFIHPKYLNNPKPAYPQEAKKRGVQGEVTLRVEVLASGQVGQIEIKRSSGHEILDRSALATVRQWQFVPAKRGKESIPLWVNIPITFRIE